MGVSVTVTLQKWKHAFIMFFATYLHTVTYYVMFYSKSNTFSRSR